MSIGLIVMLVLVLSKRSCTGAHEQKLRSFQVSYEDLSIGTHMLGSFLWVLKS